MGGIPSVGVILAALGWPFLVEGWAMLPWEESGEAPLVQARMGFEEGARGGETCLTLLRCRMDGKRRASLWRFAFESPGQALRSCFVAALSSR